VEVGRDEVAPPRLRDDLTAAALGLVALALSCVPLALFLLAPDDGRRGGWVFADARNWIGLRWFCLASALGIAPVFALARLSQSRPHHGPASVPAALAQFAALPMIAGTVIQLAWWIAG
jgi:hypothetical protein